MKKIMILMITILLGFSMIACDKAADDNNDSNGDNTVNESVVDNKNLKEKYDVELNNEVSMIINEDKEVWTTLECLGPNYHTIENIYSTLFIVDNERDIAVTMACEDRSENLYDAHEKAFKEFCRGMNCEAESIKNLVIEKDEKVNINGIDMYKFEGMMDATFWSDKVYNVKTVGYSFILDEVPCSIQGVVINRSPEEQEKQIVELRDIIDEMVKTVEMGEL